MANLDNPNGFRVTGCLGNYVPVYVPLLEVASGANGALAAGDFVIQDGSAVGYIDIAASTSGQLLGVATTPCSASVTTDTTVFVCVDPMALYQGQCSGTGAQADILNPCDIEGTTGIMEINEDANTEDVIMPIALSQSMVGGGNGNTIGANCRFDIIIYRPIIAWIVAAK